jgi:hypothetical protein
MTPQRLARRLGATAAVVCLGAAAVGTGAAPAGAGTAPAVKITATGVGGVKIGKTYTALRKRKLIGKIAPGCELGGPNTRSARLRAPLQGGVDFTLSSPRMVTNITVTGGATARGVGVGATIADIKAAYPKAKEDHTTEETFGVTLVKIPKSGGGKLQFAVDTTTGKVTQIGVPFIAFCE